MLEKADWGHLGYVERCDKLRGQRGNRIFFYRVPQPAEPRAREINKRARVAEFNHDEKPSKKEKG